MSDKPEVSKDEEELEDRLLTLLCCNVLAPENKLRFLNLDDVWSEFGKNPDRSAMCNRLRGLCVVSAVRGFSAGQPYLRELWGQVVERVVLGDERARYAKRVVDFVDEVLRSLGAGDEATQQRVQGPWAALEAMCVDQNVHLALDSIATMIAVEFAEQDRLREIARLEPGLAG